MANPLNNVHDTLYDDAHRYDLVAGTYATGHFLDFYKRQIARYGEPSLELACGTGRLTIPLVEAKVDVTGIDRSAQMLELARAKAVARSVNLPLIRSDVRNFNLNQKFRLIFFPANSFQHLLRREEVESCFACVRHHLASGGRFVIDIFNPSLTLLSRDPNRRYPLGEYEDSETREKIIVTTDVRYDAISQINNIRFYYQRAGAIGEDTILSFQMRIFFPQEIEALLAYNGFTVECKYGDYDETAFSDGSPKQLIICYPTESSDKSS
jgi:SAM-dependent methyltransferase